MGLDALKSEAVRAWFEQRYPSGPTDAQRRAWPLIAEGKHVLISAPTGTGKTIAAFLAILDRWFLGQRTPSCGHALECVYVSPLRSLGYDIERNLELPLLEISQRLGHAEPCVRVGVRTGDTPASQRRRLRESPPSILITTPESLALLLSQSAWNDHWAAVRHIVVDEIHALVPSKRGADLAVSLERLTHHARIEPQRIGLSATCRPIERVGRFLVGSHRTCDIVEAASNDPRERLDLTVEPLIQADEAVHSGLAYRRLLRIVDHTMQSARTTVVFANTRAFTEKITLDLRLGIAASDPTCQPDTVVAAHHSALDAERRRRVEAELKAGRLKAVVSSTSLEMGIDIGSVDVAILAGLPGSVTACLQRVGRAGHARGAPRRGVLTAATPAELISATVTTRSARLGEIEDARSVRSPLDVLCQQLIGMACAQEWEAPAAFELIRRAEPFARLSEGDFRDCLHFLAGQSGAPSGMDEPSETGELRSSPARLRLQAGVFSIRSRRVLRWLWSNIGTITSEESVRVQAGVSVIGTVEASYADRLLAGDRFLLDGQVLEVKSLRAGVLRVKRVAGEPTLPRWTSDRQSLSPELAARVAAFRETAAELLVHEGSDALARWLRTHYDLGLPAARTIERLYFAQLCQSEIPPAGGILIEECPAQDGMLLAFHAPLGRAACEALGRAVSARLGRRLGKNLSLMAADLGWSLRLPTVDPIDEHRLRMLFATERFEQDVLAGLDSGRLVATRFRHVASTALMVLRNPVGRRTRVGGQSWVSDRLYPLVRAASPDHPLIREARREALDDVLDTQSAREFIEQDPVIQFRRLSAPSPFCVAWLDPAASGEALEFESPVQALERLHQRLHGGHSVPASPRTQAGMPHEPTGTGEAWSR